jgi:signal peptidase I
LSKDQFIDGGIRESDSSSVVLVGRENSEPRRVVQLIRERGHVVLRAVGGSMGPWLVPGDILIVQQTEPQKIMCGNMIVFLQDERLIVHRVIAKLGVGASGELSWKTKGDSAPQTDPPVLENELLGRVSSIERAGRSRSLESPLQVAFGWLLAQISPFSGFVYSGTRMIRHFSGISSH